MPVRFEPRGRSLAVRIGKRLPETRDVRLQRLRRGRRRALAPEIVDERVLRHDLVRAQEQRGEQRALLGAAEVEPPAVSTTSSGPRIRNSIPLLSRPSSPHRLLRARHPAHGATDCRGFAAGSQPLATAGSATPAADGGHRRTEEEPCCIGRSRGSRPAQRWPLTALVAIGRSRGRERGRPPGRPRHAWPGAVAQTNE